MDPVIGDADKKWRWSEGIMSGLGGDLLAGRNRPRARER